MAISEMKGQGWRAIPTQYRKASDILTSTLAAFLFSSHPKGERDREGGAENAGVENAGVEIAREDSRGGNCRSGKYGSENVWKTVRTENKNSHQLIITDSTHPISKDRLKLELSNLVHREAISSLTKKIKKITPKRAWLWSCDPFKFFSP